MRLGLGLGLGFRSGSGKIDVMEVDIQGQRKVTGRVRVRLGGWDGLCHAIPHSTLFTQ